MKKQRDSEKETAKQSQSEQGGGDQGTNPPVSEGDPERGSQGDRLREYEKALVDRIADVDDDRRATENRLQRAWQTQREEIDERLRRQAALMLGLIAVFAIVFGIALLLVYRQARMEQPQPAAAVPAARQELSQSPSQEGVSAQLQDMLDGVSAEVEQISSGLARLREDMEASKQSAAGADAQDRKAAETALSQRIGALEAEQDRLAVSLGSLKSAVQALEARRPSAAADGSPDGDMTMQEVKPQSAASSLPAAETSAPPDESTEQPGAASEDEGSADSASAEPAGQVAEPEQPATPAEGAYGLQLIGFFEPDSMGEFVSRTNLPSRVYYVRQKYRGRSWYALIHSLHPDYAAAEQALAQLSPDLKALNPWIRPLKKDLELQTIETESEGDE